LGGVPLAMLDMLGASMVNRIAHRLQQQGVGATAVLSEASQFPERNLGPEVCWFKAGREQLWRYAEALFNDFAQSGAELVVVMRLGSYINLDLEPLLQFHLDHHSRLTQVRGSSGNLLDLLVISASRRNDAAFMFRNMLSAFRLPPEIYQASGYENPLETVADLRCLALDSLAGKTGLQPQGTEIKPGVWIGQSARIDSRARVLAPAYVGAHSRIRPMAVITRGSVIERHCHIDCGTVIEDSTILPFSHVGAGLDVSFSVVGFRRVVHLARQVDIEIADELLIGMASTSAPVRALNEMLSVALGMPKTLLASLRAKKQEVPATLPEAIQAPSPALSAATVEQQDRADRHFATELMAARRYGNE
jgi:hypothetical protein